MFASYPYLTREYDFCWKIYMCLYARAYVRNLFITFKM